MSQCASCGVELDPDGLYYVYDGGQLRCRTCEKRPYTGIEYPYQTPDNGGTTTPEKYDEIQFRPISPKDKAAVAEAISKMPPLPAPPGRLDPLKVAGDTGGVTLEGLAAMSSGETVIGKRQAARSKGLASRAGKPWPGGTVSPEDWSVLEDESECKAAADDLREACELFGAETGAARLVAGLKDRMAFIERERDEALKELAAAKSVTIGGKKYKDWHEYERENLIPAAEMKNCRFKPTPSEQLSRAFEVSEPGTGHILGAKDWQAD